ncbi:MAG: hypothetical protein UY94_C0026G0005 [Parcubacteria group bacterium GW2011_GWA2_56_21]|nr:MAG: hypothetical protein UY94_C0026G0005 [Parcubacteria group bacterium GW2011_GWA2_56_21]
MCGFTLIELLIALAILAILIAGIVSAFSGFTKAEAQKGAATGVLSLLETARSETLASKGGSRYGVHLDSSGATLFAGSSYGDESVPEKTITVSPSGTMELQ